MFQDKHETPWSWEVQNPYYTGRGKGEEKWVKKKKKQGTVSREAPAMWILETRLTNWPNGDARVLEELVDFCPQSLINLLAEEEIKEWSLENIKILCSQIVSSMNKLQRSRMLVAVHDRQYEVWYSVYTLA